MAHCRRHPDFRAGLDVFDAVHPVPRVHPRAKIDCMPLSRFDRTLYLDSDTLALATFGDLFDLLERFDLALAHDMRRASGLKVRTALVRNCRPCLPRSTTNP